MDTTNLIVYLPFDESATQDLCGNEWTAYDTTSIDDTNAISNTALQLNKGYLRSNSAITFGGADFTVSFYAYVSFNSENWTAPFSAVASLSNARSGQIVFRRNNTNTYFNSEIYNSSGQSLGSVQVNNLTNALHHFEYDYSHADSKFRIFIDGVLKATHSCSLERLARYIFLGTNNYNQNSQRMVGSIEEFLLYDGVALHTDNFTPPTDEDYEQLKLKLGKPFSLEANMERVITNAAWKPSMNLKFWLPFNRTPTEDLCGNEWTLNGDATIEEAGAINGNALQVTNSTNEGQYGWLDMAIPRLYMTSGITLGGQSFTIKIYQTGIKSTLRF